MSESARATLLRRLVTIPGYVIVWCLWLAAAPLWLPALAVLDLVSRNRGVALRSAGVLTVYLTCEVVGIVMAGGLWAARPFLSVDSDEWEDIHFRLEAWWGSNLFRAMVRLFGLSLRIESDADLGRGPYLLLLRHASTCDTVLASALVSREHALRLRYTLKSELLWDPCLDIVGHRLPNVFVDRSSQDPAQEISRIRDLGKSLGPADGVLIYPEGTRFSETKRQRVLTRLQQQGDSRMLDYAHSLCRTLPPRPGGTLALLEEAPDADVVICSHTGFEGSASLAAIWNGALLDQLIQVEFRRIPRHEIPVEREARVAWLQEEWRRVDAWIVSRQRVTSPQNRLDRGDGGSQE